MARNASAAWSLALHDADYDALTDLFMSDHPLPKNMPATQALGTMPAARSVDAEPSAPHELPEIPALPRPRPATKLRLAPAMPEASGVQVEAKPFATQDAIQHSTSPQIEGLILGHLPVLGAAWVTQYAKAVAEAKGHNIALLRCHEGQAWLDIVQPKHAQPIHTTDPDDASEPDLLACIRRAAREAPSWMLRVDEAYEPDLLSIASVNTVTLLTGADDPAILASYRTIKHLAQLCEELGRPLGESSVPGALRIQLVIMGADAAKAREADTKIRRSALAFLGAALLPSQAIAKISPCSTVALYRGATQASIAALMDEATSARDSAGMTGITTGNATGSTTGITTGGTGVSPVPSSPPLSNEGAAAAARDATDQRESVPTRNDTPAPRQWPRKLVSAVAEGTGETPVPPSARTAPQPAARGFQSSLVASGPALAVASVVTSQASLDDTRGPHATLDAIALLAASDVPGLAALPLHCPYAPGVRFGLDASGALHAAVLSEAAGNEAAGLASLQTAQTWAREHASLLALAVQASRGHAQLGTAPCTLHLLTTTSTALRSLMHSPVRVHLVVRVGAGGIASRVV
jgi:hypothetical protein